MAKSQTKKTKRERERDPWFNPYRYAASERATIAIGEALYSFEKQENRKRARKPKDKQWLRQIGPPIAVRPHPSSPQWKPRQRFGSRSCQVPFRKVQPILSAWLSVRGMRRGLRLRHTRTCSDTPAVTRSPTRGTTRGLSKLILATATFSTLLDIRSYLRHGSRTFGATNTHVKLSWKSIGISVE
jgi:hypothetical protein